MIYNEPGSSPWRSEKFHAISIRYTDNRHFIVTLSSKIPKNPKNYRKLSKTIDRTSTVNVNIEKRGVGKWQRPSSERRASWRHDAELHVAEQARRRPAVVLHAVHVERQVYAVHVLAAREQDRAEALHRRVQHGRHEQVVVQPQVRRHLQLAEQLSAPSARRSTVKRKDVAISRYIAYRYLRKP